MADQEEPWPRLVAHIVLCGCAGLPQKGKVDVIICDRGGMHLRGPRQISILNFGHFDLWLVLSVNSEFSESVNDLG
jgi:hypothetical protein